MESCKEIGNRVKELRNQAELSQQDLADALRVKRETVKFWEAGERYFKAADIIALAQFFNVSADYILGLSANPTADHDLDYVCNYTGLSIPAIEAIRSTEDKKTASEFVSKFFSGLIERLAEIGAAANSVLYDGEPIKPGTKGAMWADLNYLSLYLFERYCREIPGVLFDISKIEEAGKHGNS